MKNEEWPTLNYATARETYETIHLWTQIVGKIKLAKMPWMNHSWHITLFITPTGLSTGIMPCDEGDLEIHFDFIDHQLVINKGTDKKMLDLSSLSVAKCYHQTLELLKEMGFDVHINPIPNEMVDPIPLDMDEQHATYHPDHASDLHKVLLKINKVFTHFRSEFIGKSSPVHFFWGSFDLALSRFSGREAPLHPGGVPNLPDWVAREAYSHEVNSFGFWPGNESVPFAAFYSYIYPEPEGFKNASIKPESAYYHKELGEYILKYEDVRKSDNPSETLLSFLRSCYEAAASLAKWDKESFELKVLK